MTKAELIEAIKDLPDDTDIFVPSRECSGDWMHACYIEIICDGSDGCQPEIELSGD